MQDEAMYHTSATTTAFVAQQTARLQVVQLPTSSPNDTPIEKFWKKITQHDAPLHDCPAFEALPEQVKPGHAHVCQGSNRRARAV
jgi:hypothetical protein